MYAVNTPKDKLGREKTASVANGVSSAYAWNLDGTPASETITGNGIIPNATVVYTR